MTGNHELAGMVNKVLTLAEFEKYLIDELPGKMGPWRPSMIVLHNTGLNPHWTVLTSAAESLQLMKNSSVTWASPPNNWSSGPHMEIGPNGLIVLASPLWKPGTHSPSWNKYSWGIEMVGDFDRQPFTELQKNTVVGVLKALFAFLGKAPNNETFKLHKEDPHTTHKHCPGVNCGDKATWLARLNSVTPAEKLLDMPHLKPYPVAANTFIQQREALRLVAYLDGQNPDGTPRYSTGYGTQIKPDGTRVVAGEVCTLEQAAVWQAARTQDDWQRVLKLITVPISDGLAIAILSFCYEFSVASFAGSTFLKKINEGDLRGAANGLLLWNEVKDKATGQLVVSPGLQKRRLMEVALFDPSFPVPMVATPAKAAPAAPKALPTVMASPTPQPPSSPAPAPGTAPMAPKLPPATMPKTFLDKLIQMAGDWLQNYIQQNKVKS